MKRLNRIWPFILVSIAMLSGVFLPSVAQANMGPPWAGGQLVAEPTGLEKVAIAHETLRIDLRPLQDAQPVFVEAIYRIDNQGPQQKLDLVFATGVNKINAFQVWLNDQAIASQPAPAETLPASWQPPKQTPSLDNTSALDYYPDYATPQASALAFTLVLPPGAQTIKVRYAAEAMWRHSDDPTDYWQFAYILAPARAWAKFGGLDATITLPSGWRAAATPQFARQGDQLQASFANLPADAIALTVQAPVSWLYFVLTYFSLGLLMLVGVGGAILCWRTGRALGRQQATVWRGVLLPLLWGIMLCLFGLLTIFAPDWALPAFQHRDYGYGKPFALIGVIALSLLVMPIGWVMIGVTRWFTRRSSSRTAVL